MVNQKINEDITQLLILPFSTKMQGRYSIDGCIIGRWRGNFNVQYPQFWISLSATPTGATDAAFSKPLCSGVGFVIGFMLPICYEHFLEGHQCTTPLTKSLRGGSASWRGWLRKATTTTPHILLPYPFVISGYFSLEKKGANFLISARANCLALSRYEEKSYFLHGAQIVPRAQQPGNGAIGPLPNQSVSREKRCTMKNRKN